MRDTPKAFSFCKEIHRKPELLYLIIATVFCIVFTVIFTPWNSVDGPTHFMASYRFSNILMGLPEWSVRGNDQIAVSAKPDGTIEETFRFYELFCKDSSITDDANTFKYMNFYSAFNYIPFIAAITIGRLLNLGIIPIAYLGRVLSAIFYILLFYHAIKTTPFGKHIFAFVSMFPMTLHIITSYTYDSAVLAVVFNYFSCLFRLKDRDSLKKDRYLFELLFWCIALGLIKGGSFAGLLMLLLILIDRKKSTKENMAVILLIVSGLASILCSNILFNPSEEFFQFHPANPDNLDFSLIYKNPGQYLRLWINTVKEYSFPWLFEAIGTNAGYWQIFVQQSLPFAILLLIPTLVAGYLGRSDETFKPGKKLLITALIVTLVYLYITPATVLRDNPVTNTEINYCTGRYFLPFYPLILSLILSLFSKPKQNTQREWVIPCCYAVYAVLMGFIAFTFKEAFFYGC